MAAVATLATTQARAVVVVDPFTAAQTVVATTPGVTSGTVSDASILGGTRTLSVFLDTTPPFAVGAASVRNGVFSGSFTGPNTPPGGSYFDLLYNTTATNVTAGNQGISFSASSQGGARITITANGTSTAVLNVPDAPGFTNFFVSFASFSNSSVFTALTSLDFRTTFPNVSGSGPSISINSPILIAAIPEPSVVALGSVACVVLGGLRLRRKQQG